MMQPFVMSRIKNHAKFSVVSDSELHPQQVDYERKVIYPSESLINYMLESVLEIKTNLYHKTGVLPKRIIVSNCVYEQIIVYNFNKKKEIYPKNFADLEIIVDPTLDGYQIKVIMNYYDEYLFEDIISKIKRFLIITVA